MSQSQSPRSAVCPFCGSENLRYFHSAGMNRVACNDCQKNWEKGLHNDLHVTEVTSTQPYAEVEDTATIYKPKYANGDTKRLSHENSGFRRGSRNHKKVKK